MSGVLLLSPSIITRRFTGATAGAGSTQKAEGNVFDYCRVQPVSRTVRAPRTVSAVKGRCRERDADFVTDVTARPTMVWKPHRQPSHANTHKSAQLDGTRACRRPSHFFGVPNLFSKAHMSGFLAVTCRAGSHEIRVAFTAPAFLGGHCARRAHGARNWLHSKSKANSAYAGSIME